ncbi:MAG: IS4/IS5 family transposase [bacterium]|nr:IS4/IS5 family transposase [bacterium]
MATKIMKDDWDILKKFLPVGWEKKATELGALRRKRKMKSAETLLRVLLIHLAEGKSLRTTSAYASEVGLCDLTDVALLQRLQASQEWFHWIAVELFALLQGSPLPNALFHHDRIRLVDGSSISEPGSTGTDWRFHYSFLLSNLRCDTFTITSVKTGEAFQRNPVSPGDLFIGDRGYCQRKGIVYVLQQHGHVRVWFHSTNLPLFRRSGRPFVVLEHLRQLDTEDIGDWDVWFKNPDGGNVIKGRLCSIRKSQDAVEKAKKQLRHMASKKGRTLRPETLEHAE